MKEGKSFQIPKYQILQAYKCVKANKGAGGIDGINFEEYENDLKNNLYKLWNRMSSDKLFTLASKRRGNTKEEWKNAIVGYSKL